MLSMRASGATGPNRGVTALRASRGEGNGAWLARSEMSDGVVLIGGAGVVDFRVRVAQSVLRHDLTPSHWSMAGILVDDRTFLSVPLDGLPDASAVPATNGIRTCAIGDYDDPERYPNVAVLAFAGGGSAIREAAAEVGRQRAVLDLAALMVAWLAYGWGVSDGNPLVDGRGIPSAAFVEACHGVANIELTPGLASAGSCPEAIWQSAKWWGDYYRETARLGATAAAAAARSPGHAAPRVPAGRVVIRQPAAAIAGPPDEPERTTRRRKRSGS